MNSQWDFFKQLRREKVLSMAEQINAELASKAQEKLQIEILAQKEANEGRVAAHFRSQD
ncbi:MAG: hypothetical protein ACK5N8_02160 [Alphaproteobacteria bacterium]